MTTPLAPPPDLPTTEPARRLDRAEAEAADEIDAALDEAAAAGLTAAALAAAAAAIIAAIRRAARAALGVGGVIALTGTGIRPPRERRLQPQPLPTSIDADVEALLADAGVRLAAGPDRRAAAAPDRRRAGPPERRVGAPQGRTDVASGSGAPSGTAAPDRRAEWERTRRRLHLLAVTKIHQAASAGTAMYTRWLGTGLVWVTRRDGRACAFCRAMDGRRATPDQGFAPPRGIRVWSGFRGLPPAHPRCRCRVAAAGRR